MMYGAGVNGRREEQIQELLRTRPECTPKNAERSVFDFGLNVKRAGRTDLVIIRITLPPAFPNAAPHAAVLTPNVRHPIVDAVGNVTGCSSLYAWNGYSRLAQVVTDIMTQFVNNPPTVGTSGNAAGNGFSAGTTSGISDQPGSRNSLQKPRADSDDGVLIPPAPHTFPEIESMDIERLKELQNDDDEFLAFFASLPMPCMTQDMKEQILLSNEKQARANLAHKARVEELVEATLRAKDEAETQWKRFKDLEKRQAAAMRKFDPLRLLTELESSASKVDDESETLASEFLAGEVSLQDFVNRQLELRKLYHLRRAKAERFRAQLKH